MLSIGRTARSPFDQAHAVPQPQQQGGPRPSGPRGGRGRSDTPVFGRGKAQPQQQGDLSFEDMMSRFESQSEEKISDLKKVTENGPAAAVIPRQ